MATPRKSDPFLTRMVLIPGFLMCCLNYFWFKFELIHPFPLALYIVGGVVGLLYTIYFALTTAVTCDRRYPLTSITKNDLYRLREIEFSDVLANIVVFIVFTYISVKCVNGLIPIQTVGHDTTVLNIETHVSRSSRGWGSTETYTLNVASWVEKGIAIRLDIDRTTGLKLNVSAPIHIETKIGLLGLEFYRMRHQTFTFQKGYVPPFRQPD